MEIQILAVNYRNGVKEGKPWEFYEAQCIGNLGPKAGFQVFTMRLFDELTQVKPGKYLAQFGGYVKEGKLMPRVVGLKPVAA